MPIENTTPFNVRLNPVPLIRLPIGLVDIFGKKMSSKCDSLGLIYIRLRSPRVDSFSIP